MFDWMAGIAIKKGINRGVKVFAGLLSGEGVLQVLKQFGVSITIDESTLAAAIGGAIIGLYEILRNYQKSRGEKAVKLP